MILRNQCNPTQNIVSLRVFHHRSLNVTTNLMEFTGYVFNKNWPSNVKWCIHTTNWLWENFTMLVSKIKSILPIIFHLIYRAVCSDYRIFMWWLWECVLNLIIISIIIIIIIIIIIKSDVWITNRCSGLGNETMARVVCLTMFLCWTNCKFPSASSSYWALDMTCFMLDCLVFVRSSCYDYIKYEYNESSRHFYGVAL